MKSQLLYVFVLAAPLLMQLLSREPRVDRDDADTGVVAEAKSTPAKESAPRSEPAEPSAPASKSPPARATRIPAAHAFMLM